MAGKTKTVDGNQLPMSAFAYTPSEDEPSTWKLRIDDAHHVGGAIAALGKGYRGEKVEIPAPDRAKVVAKVRAAWKKFHPDAKADEMPDALRASEDDEGDGTEMSEPTVSDVHVDAPLTIAKGKKRPTMTQKPAPMLDGENDEEDGDGDEGKEPAKERPTRNFLSKLKELLRGKVQPEEYDEAVKSARAHAGGKGKAARKAYDPMAGYGDDADDEEEENEPRLEKADPAVKYRSSEAAGERCGTCRFFENRTCTLVEGFIDPDGVCNLWKSKVQAYREQSFAEAIEALKFADAPDWIPFLPKPGVYKHPTYGPITLSPERITNFVKNFNAGLYQDKVPLDAEHQTKLSGASGWITQLRQMPDGSAQAHVDWTGRGRSFLEDNRFKFVSPEWYDDWEDPATGKRYRDIVIGGALTTRPFFKEGSLPALAASETDARRRWLPVRADVTPARRSESPAKGDTMGEPVQLTEEQAKQFAELQAEAKKLRETVDAQSTQLKTLSEQNTRMLDEAQTKRFTDEVLGKSTSSGVRWVGDVSKHVGLLKKLAKTFGEDSEELRDYITEHRATAEQLRTSALFSERGSEAFGEDESAEHKINALTEKYATEHKLDYDKALERIASENPDLYRRYRVETSRGQ